MKSLGFAIVQNWLAIVCARCTDVLRKSGMGQNEHDFGAKNVSFRAKNEVQICDVSPMKLDKKPPKLVTWEGVRGTSVTFCRPVLFIPLTMLQILCQVRGKPPVR